KTCHTRSGERLVIRREPGRRGREPTRLEPDAGEEMKIPLRSPADLGRHLDLDVREESVPLAAGRGRESDPPARLRAEREESALEVSLEVARGVGGQAPERAPERPPRAEPEAAQLPPRKHDQLVDVGM